MSILRDVLGSLVRIAMIAFVVGLVVGLLLGIRIGLAWDGHLGAFESAVSRR